MKKLLLILSTFFSIFILGMFLPTKAFAAPRIFFDPSSKSTTTATQFDINVNIDTDSQDTFGAEAVISYSGNDLEVKSISNGSFFPDFNSAFDSSKIVIRAYSSSPLDYKKGSGIVAKITFLAKTTTSATASFVCGGASDTQILSSTGTNILSCSSLNQFSLAITTSSGGDDINNNPSTSEPNYCGGTCGSNSNCQSGLYCYIGFCRNPSCPSKTDCSCTSLTYVQSTAKPIIKPVATTKVSPTPQVITLQEYSTPSRIVEETPMEKVTEENMQETFNINKFLPYIGAILFLVILISLILKSKKKKIEQITPITPEVTVPPVSQPTENTQENIPSQPEVPSNPTIPQTPDNPTITSEEQIPPVPPTDPQNPNI